MAGKSSDSMCAPIPKAPRPQWMMHGLVKQKEVEANSWSMSIAQWILFMRACVETDTWRALAAQKGEYNITMYDVRDHFVNPWTKGTGSSVALLMNPNPKQAELMLSHAWAGSVVETYNCLQNLVNHYGVPSTTHIFYCVFSMYQPEDGAPGGLTISEQLELEPFARIIESRPKHGMWVVHTTIYDLETRLWAVHEVDECLVAGVTMHGLFDVYAWKPDGLDACMYVRTAQSECRDQDRQMLVKKIESRGGFSRLDASIADFRLQMKNELQMALRQNSDKRLQTTFGEGVSGVVAERFDWKLNACFDLVCYPYISTKSFTAWKFDENWKCAYNHVEAELGLAPTPQNGIDMGVLDARCRRVRDDGSRREQIATEMQESVWLMARFDAPWQPLGGLSFPFGPVYWEIPDEPWRLGHECVSGLDSQSEKDKALVSSKSPRFQWEMSEDVLQEADYALENFADSLRTIDEALESKCRVELRLF